jgi:multidrug efflux pump
MTSFAFILGVVPLVIGEGAGKEMRRSLGTAVFSGMIGVTVFGLLLTPVFYAVIIGWSGHKSAVPAAATPHAPAVPVHETKVDGAAPAGSITTAEGMRQHAGEGEGTS